MKRLDIESWNRRSHYLNFREFSDPFFNITASVDVSKMVKISKECDFSFFSISFFLVLKVVNEIENFRYRIRGNDVVVLDVVHGGCTVLNQNETFSYCYFDYIENLREFSHHVESVIELNATKNGLDPRRDRDNLIHASVLPWVSFTAFEHAKNIGVDDSIPKIVLGRFFVDGAQTLMPISVAVNHALMDGIHVGKFFQKYDEYARNFDQFF